MQKKLNIKVGDSVRVICGASKGQEGNVTAIDRTKMRVTVQGVNMIKKHNKPSASNPQGGIEEKEGTDSKRLARKSPWRSVENWT